MYTFDHISVKQRQLPDQQVDSVQLCEYNSDLNSYSGLHLTPSHVWSDWLYVAFHWHNHQAYIRRSLSTKMVHCFPQYNMIPNCSVSFQLILGVAIVCAFEKYLCCEMINS